MLSRVFLGTLADIVVLSSVLAVTHPEVTVPQWVLECVDCKFKFEYSQIGDVGMSGLRPQPKPDLPPNGTECVCPNCGNRAVYRRTDLLYQGSPVRTWPT